MISISSHKAQDKNPEIAKNQLRARRSWDVFEEIYYFGQYEEALDGDNTQFIPCEDFPTIKSLCEFAAGLPGWACIINADIVVSPMMREAIAALERSSVRCALSRRYDLWTQKLIDMGLDWFAAKPEIWKMAAQAVGSNYRIGHPIWDTWMISFFTHMPGVRCADLTPAKLIFHPAHDGRDRPHTIQPPKNDPLLNDVRWPATRISNVTNAKGHFTFA